MTWVRHLREMFAKATPITSARLIPTWQAGRALPAPEDFTKLAQEGYREAVLVATCIWVLSTSAAEPRLVVKKKSSYGESEAVTDPRHPLVMLLSKPNPEQSTYAFVERLITDQQVWGNWFLRKLRAKAGNVVAMWPYRADRIKIVPDKDGWVDHYLYARGGGGAPDKIPAEDMIHDPLHPDPLNDYWGLSPIAVLARTIDTDTQAQDFLRAFFTNNGTPAGLLKFKKIVNPTDRQNLKDLWQKQHTGPQGWQTVSVLDNDAEYQSIGSDPSKMKLDGVFSETESRICGAFGVPAILAGTLVGLQRSTFANFREARQSLWKDTLVPLYKRMGDRLTHSLAPEFGEDLCIEFDLATVEALQEDLNTQRTFALSGWEKGLLTKNEARELSGYAKTAEGDMFKGEQKKPEVAPVAPEPEEEPVVAKRRILRSA